MAVQFILGRSGTGKTRYCIEAIKRALLEASDEQKLILLVPEQASYQAERAILNDKRIAGYSRLNVLSFDRLQFLLSGKSTTRPTLSRVGRQMVVQKILREQRSELGVFGTSVNRPGLGRQMAESIAELHRYAKTPADIEQLLGKLRKDEHNNLAAGKFADIGLVLSEYLKLVEGRFIDPDVELNEARRIVAGAAFTRGVRLWVDGFASFTAGELAILAELMKAARDTQIALCLDSSRIDLTKPDAAKVERASLFSPTERTYAELVEMVKKCKLKLVKPVILAQAVRFSGSVELSHIEQHIFEPEPKKMRAGGGVRILSAPNARAEAQFVAREILRLVREKDYRYRDIAVIASDISRYQHYIKAYFDDYDVPFFIDRRKSLNQHAVIQLIDSALRAATGEFSHGDIFAYLKTGLVPIKNSEVELLENYCLAFGVGGSDWQSEKNWHFAGEEEQDFDEKLVNQIRLRARKPLIELRDELRQPSSPEKTVSSREFTRVIFDFLDGVGVGEKIEELIEEALEREDYAAADEHRQFYSRLIDVFDELVEVFGECKMSGEDYLSIINSAFSQLTLAFIPPSLDQVLVGSIERSRHPDLKAVFLIGATQKEFPVPIGYSGVLTDDDRVAAESADFSLATATREMLVERQYLSYIAFTRASEFMCITYPLADDKGSATMRSQFIGDVQSLFEDLSEESIAGERVQIEKVCSKTELTDLLCGQLGKDALRADAAEDKRLNELLKDICLDEVLAKSGAIVRSALDYDNFARLDKTLVGRFFGRPIRSSATRLSTFAECPYRYFAKYTLELEERKEFKFEPLDVGKFYHCILDILLKQIIAGGKDFATIGDEELLGLLREQVSRFVLTDSFISNFCRRRAYNLYIIQSAGEVLEESVLAIAEMVRAGDFRPILSEAWFGEARDDSATVGDYEISLSDGRKVFLNGKIDRVDVAETDGRKTAIIFDYKRRDKSFRWSELFYGLDMQLAIYMLAVRKAGGTPCKNIVGAFYMPVEVSVGKTHKANGIFNGEFFQQLDGKVESHYSRFYNFQVSKENGQYGDYGRSGALRPGDFEKALRFAEEKVIKLTEEILSGRIEVKPYRLGTESPCGYCEYKAVCRFDWLVNDYNFLKSARKTDVLKEIGKGNG